MQSPCGERKRGRLEEPTGRQYERRIRRKGWRCRQNVDHTEDLIFTGSYYLKYVVTLYVNIHIIFTKF